MKKTQNQPIILIRILLMLILAYLAFYMFRVAKEKKYIEGLDQKKHFILKTNDDIFDTFYCDIYNKLMYDKNKVDYEIEEITRVTKINKNSTILDVGSGNGHHVGALCGNKVNAVGIDLSDAMVKSSQNIYPKCYFKTGDFLKSFNGHKNLYSHILCMYFTIYYIKDKTAFFKKCYNLLKSGGYLILHLVNRNTFDPMVSLSNPLVIVSPQSVAKERITQSVVRFEGFQYKANFKMNSKQNIGLFEEKMIDNKKKVRKNIHTLFMEKQNDIIQKALNQGFLLNGKIDMTPVQYENQYLYILQSSK
jgi:cyclopropane fatty-acyl-phospholipid synthase-like methyltransferase